MARPKLRIVSAKPVQTGWIERYAERGYVPQYHGAETRCPGCHRSQWYVGRLSAECAVCGLALPLAPTNNSTMII